MGPTDCQFKRALQGRIRLGVCLERESEPHCGCSSDCRPVSLPVLIIARRAVVSTDLRHREYVLHARSPMMPTHQAPSEPASFQFAHFGYRSRRQSTKRRFRKLRCDLQATRRAQHQAWTAGRRGEGASQLGRGRRHERSPLQLQSMTSSRAISAVCIYLHSSVSPIGMQESQPESSFSSNVI